jgi:hypothetical protein
MPVKFRCGHAFGERCMKEQLFRMPDLITTQLRPLEFEEGSMGFRLAQGLRKCVEEARNDSTIQPGDHVRKACSKLMKRLWKNQDTGNYLDRDWHIYIRNVLNFRNRVLAVQIFENAIVSLINNSISARHIYEGCPHQPEHPTDRFNVGI